MFFLKNAEDTSRANGPLIRRDYLFKRLIIGIWGHIMKEDIQKTLYTNFYDARVKNNPKKLKKWFRQF